MAVWTFQKLYEEERKKNQELHDTIEKLKLTIRDEFAMRALSGFMAQANNCIFANRPIELKDASVEEWREWTRKQDAKLMYLIADAMMEARNK